MAFRHANLTVLYENSILNKETFNDLNQQETQILPEENFVWEKD